MAASYVHYSASANNGAPIGYFKKPDTINLVCRLCGNAWSSTKQAYLYTPKCKKCAAIAKSVLTTDPRIAEYTIEDLTFDTRLSAKVITVKCPQCSTWFSKSIRAIVKDLSKTIDPCGQCNPRYRIKSGVLFLANYPRFADSLLTELSESSEDFYAATSDLFDWIKGCGHTERLIPSMFLSNPDKCVSCSDPYRGVTEVDCSDCGARVKMKRADRAHFVKAPELFCCIDCREVARVLSNSLRNKINSWTAVEWSANNCIQVDSISASSKKRVLWECLESGHVFERYAYASVDSCPRCAGSSLERLVDTMLTGFSGRVLKNDRTLIAPLELDFYFPDFGIAIEVNGLYWHSEANLRDQDFHASKYSLCSSKGVQLLTLWEDDLLERYELVKNQLLQKLQIGETASSSECRVQRIDAIEAYRFFSDKCFQTVSIDDSVGSPVSYGLFLQEKLLAVSAWSVLGKSAELLGYASSMLVPADTFCRLLEGFQEECSQVSSITAVTSNEFAYEAEIKSSGFVVVEKLEPDFSYLVKGKRVSKSHYIEGAENEPFKIWDCGSVCWLQKL